MEFADFGTHLDAHFGVEVGQRLVEEERGRFAHDGAPHRDALPLPAGQRFRPAVQVVDDPQNLGGFAHPPLDLGFLEPAQLQAEGHVVVHRHVRVERVVLENHRDVAILGRDIVDEAVADADRALGDLFQPRHHAQGRGFAATRRTDENQELTVGDLQVEIPHGNHVAGVHLPDVFKNDLGHVGLPPSGRAWDNPPDSRPCRGRTKAKV